MTERATSYSSIEAFLAHLRALRAARLPTSEDDRLLATLTAVLGELSQAERDSIINEAGDPAGRRRRERAMLKLRRDLRARGMLAG